MSSDFESARNRSHGELDIPGFVAALKASGALQFGTFTLASGKTSSYYVDIKKAITRPDLLRTIAKAMAPYARGASRIAGVELGAVPIAAAVSLASGKPYVIVRKATKEHGTKHDFEGELNRGDLVLFVEDVVTTARRGENGSDRRHLREPTGRTAGTHGHSTRPRHPRHDPCEPDSLPHPRTRRGEQPAASALRPRVLHPEGCDRPALVHPVPRGCRDARIRSRGRHGCRRLGRRRRVPTSGFRATAHQGRDPGGRWRILGRLSEDAQEAGGGGPVRRGAEAPAPGVSPKDRGCDLGGWRGRSRYRHDPATPVPDRAHRHRARSGSRTRGSRQLTSRPRVRRRPRGRRHRRSRRGIPRGPVVLQR